MKAMRRCVLAGLLLALLPALARSQQPQGAASPPAVESVFPSGVEVVTVDAVVLDRHGNPVEGLTQADFSIKEDGRPQAISGFEAVGLAESPEQPNSVTQRVSVNTAPVARGDRWFVIVFDDANLSSYAAPRAREAIGAFLRRGLSDGDQVMIVPTSGGPWWTGRLPEDRETLTSFVDRLQGSWRPDTTASRIWDHEAIAIANGRDRQLEAEVARRYFENNLIPEAYPTDSQAREELDVSPGLAMVRAKARSVYAEATSRLRITLTTLSRVAASLAQLRGRKNLLLVSEGFIMDPSQFEFRELIQAARNADAIVNFVDVRGPSGSVGQPGMAGGGAEFGRAVEERDTTTALALATADAEGARSIAYDTGGTVVAGTNLADNMAKLARESRAYYLLGYTSTNTARDGKFRKIQVTVGRPDLDVRARRGYYAPSNEARRPAKADDLDPAVRAGLDSVTPAAGIPLRLTSYVFGPQEGGKRRVLLGGEADLTPLRLAPRGGKISAQLDSYVVVYGHDSDHPERQETRIDLTIPADQYERVARTGLPIRRELALAPGRYQARLLVKDTSSRLVGSVRHEFVVPENPGFQVTTPILTDEFQAGASDQPPRPVPIAHRTFAAGARLACAFSVLGAAQHSAPRVTLAYRLRRASGDELMSSPARLLNPSPQGELSPVIFLKLPDDAAGAFELVLNLRDEAAGADLEVVEAFGVTR